MSELIYNKVHQKEDLEELGSINNEVIKVGTTSDPSFATEFFDRDPVNAVIAEASPFACLTTAPGDLDPKFVESHSVYLLGGGE